MRETTDLTEMLPGLSRPHRAQGPPQRRPSTGGGSTALCAAVHTSSILTAFESVMQSKLSAAHDITNTAHIAAVDDQQLSRPPASVSLCGSLVHEIVGEIRREFEVRTFGLLAQQRQVDRAAFPEVFVERDDADRSYALLAEDVFELTQVE